MSINERLLLVRKSAKLNQETFGRRIGVTRSAICNYENGSRPISEQVILAVCREFDVNGEWLRTGSGEMMNAAPSSVLDALAREYGLRQKDYVLIEKLVKMSQAERDGIFRFMQDVVDGARGCGADPDAPVFPGGTVPPQEMSPEQLHAELDRQLSDQEGQTGWLSASGRSS